MPVDLSKPIAWRTASGDTAVLLDQLQPNILKGHTREFLTILFVSFASKSAGEQLLRGIAKSGLLKSARTHLEEVDAFNEGKRKGLANPPTGKPYAGVFLTAAGYDVLGIAKSKQPSDGFFQAGMRRGNLGDPASSKWDVHFQGVIHGALLIGDAAKQPRDAALQVVQTIISANQGVTVLGKETGQSQHNRNGDGIEHFGYVDGRSQPLFLVEEVDNERLRTDGAGNWNPAFAPARAIVADPASPDPALNFGSYFVFRKLEQDVRRFKDEERKLAKRLGLKGEDAERAGAMIVGRFEDGTPLTSQSQEGAHHPVPNDFNYESDDKGGKCPFFAHIRKVNPRGSGGFESHEDERLHIMARRGQTYGTRTDDLNDGKLSNKPTGGVGLLFMAFNANIGEQFEFAQRQWANFAAFPQSPGAAPGLDLIIGQGTRPVIECPMSWGPDPNNADAKKQTAAPPQTVTMRGGEYFFAPSLAFLRAV